jgi:uncharacterized protein YaaQ
MKLSISVLILLLLTNNTEAQLKIFETAVAYNNFIVAEQVKTGKMIQEFNNTFSNSTDSTVIHKARIAIINQADSSVKQVKNMQPFKGDTALKKVSLTLFNFYAGAAANEYARLIRLYFNTTLSNEEKRKQLEAILKTITETEAVLDKNFSEAQKAFAAKHGFTLAENDFKIND